MRRKIFDNMQVVHKWCICNCCILNIIRCTVKSISSLLHVSSTSAVNEAKMKGQKYLDLKFEINRCGNIWLEINRLGKLRKIQVATFDKSMWQAEKFERDESAAASFATKLPRSPAFSLGLIQASVKHLDFTDNAATRCMWKQVKHLDSDDSRD